jgi:hypothetical protein
MAPREVLSDQEMGEIALAYVKRKMRRESVSLDPEKIRREIGNMAKDTGVSPEKAMQFSVQILDGAFREVLVDLSK